jgi:hypothetical protein
VIDAIRDWYALARDGMEAFGAQNPDWLMGGILVGLLLSWTLTQRVKRATDLSRRATEATAFVIAAVFCVAIATQGQFWPIPWLELGIALAVGAVAPLAYKVLIRVAASRISWVADLRRDKS